MGSAPASLADNPFLITLLLEMQTTIFLRTEMSRKTEYVHNPCFLSANILKILGVFAENQKNQNWVCPIQTVSSDSAFYSISNDSITLPLKSQFKDGESFYGTELHEMGHSTGVKNRLNRKGFYENDKFNYGREELVAELISALSGVYLGISVTVREENAAYLKSWCKAIKEEPKFLFTVLADAIKGSKFIAQHLNIRLDVEEVEEEKNTKVA